MSKSGGVLQLRDVVVGAGLVLLLLVTGCRNLPAAGSLSGETDILFSEQFGEVVSGAWQLEGDDQSRATIEGGRLLITIDAPSTVHYTTLPDQTFSDFVLEVDATQQAGSPASSYGVLVRMAAPQQFYRFEVTGNGEYVVERHDGADSWVRLTDNWESSEALATGLNTTNRLAIVAEGGLFSFYANDELLTQVADAQYSQGAVALDAGTFGQPGLQVAFDNLVIREP
jgi:hypothetical protein